MTAVAFSGYAAVAPPPPGPSAEEIARAILRTRAAIVELERVADCGTRRRLAAELERALHVYLHAHDAPAETQPAGLRGVLAEGR